AGTADDEEEPEEEGREVVKGEREMAAGDDDAAIEHGAALAEEAVGEPTAGESGQVDHRRVEAVDRTRLRGLPAEAPGGERGGHEEQQERPHAVVAEAFPHLGEEEGREAERMAEEGPPRGEGEM